MKKLVCALTLGLALLVPAQAAPPSEDLQEEGFSAAQGVIVSAASRAVSRLGVQASEAGGPLTAMIGEGNTLLERAEALRHQLDRLVNDSDREVAARQQAIRAEIAANQKQQAAFRAKLAQAFPAYSELVNPRPMRSGDVRTILDPNEAMLVIVPTQYATYVFTLTRESFTWRRSVRKADEIAADVRTLRCNLDPDNCSGNAAAKAAFDRATAYRLYQDLIAPSEPLIGHKQVLYVLAGGALRSLPLGVLVTDAPEGAGNAALKATHWLIDRYALVSLPAVSSLYTLRCVLPAHRHSGCPVKEAVSDRRVSGALPFFGVGNPVLEGMPTGEEKRGAYMREGMALPETLRQLPSLPGTGSELDALAKLFLSGKDALLVQGGATETAVKRSTRLRDARLLVFATHALMGSGGDEPGLVMTPPAVPSAEDDGLLTASEVAGLQLSADLVVLSACNTARTGQDLDADGLAGLARAFIYAGARALVVSHWPVFDDVPQRLMGGFFDQLRNNPGMGRAVAFQNAVKAVKGADAEAEPRRWAAFVLVGDAYGQ